MSAVTIAYSLLFCFIKLVFISIFVSVYSLQFSVGLLVTVSLVGFPFVSGKNTSRNDVTPPIAPMNMKGARKWINFKPLAMNGAPTAPTRLVNCVKPIPALLAVVGKISTVHV